MTIGTAHDLPATTCTFLSFPVCTPLVSPLLIVGITGAEKKKSKGWHWKKPRPLASLSPCIFPSQPPPPPSANEHRNMSVRRCCVTQ